MASETFNTLGDRMKSYEKAEAGRKFMPMLPIVARMDGRGFHNFTKGLDRPFDTNMSMAMIATTKALVKDTNATVGYTQSDEITLVWDVRGYDDDIWFDGRIQKMTSHLSSLATLYFYRQVERWTKNYKDRMPTFDARIWQVPTRQEAINTLLWRELDATKNSISMASSHYYPPGQLLGKKSSERQELLFQKGVNWNDYPDHFKRGSYIKRRKVLRQYSLEELEALPEKHQVRTNPNLLIERSVIETLILPPLKNITNKEGVIFGGEDPITLSGEKFTRFNLHSGFYEEMPEGRMFS